MWCFRHLQGGKEGRPGPVREGKKDCCSSLNLTDSINRKSLDLSFVYCLYYVNTFFGRYFCFYFIIKFRNLTQREAASLAPGMLRAQPTHGACPHLPAVTGRTHGPGTSGPLRPSVRPVAVTQCALWERKARGQGRECDGGRGECLGQPLGAFATCSPAERGRTLPRCRTAALQTPLQRLWGWCWKRECAILFFLVLLGFFRLPAILLRSKSRVSLQCWVDLNTP